MRRSGGITVNRCLIALLAVATLASCKFEVSTPPEPAFEMRDFVVKEEITPKTEYSKEWNTFKGTGTLMARNVGNERNMLVWLEVRDKTIGPDAEPQLIAILFRGGLGKVEISKSKYGEISKRPDYDWSVLGWSELEKGTLQVIGPK